MSGYPLSVKQLTGKFRNVVRHWANVFVMKMPNGEPKYPKLGKLTKAVRFLPLGNVDCEIGFSENKQALHHRASL